MYPANGDVYVLVGKNSCCMWLSPKLQVYDPGYIYWAVLVIYTFPLKLFVCSYMGRAWWYDLNGVWVVYFVWKGC